MEAEALAGELRPWNRDGHAVVEAGFIVRFEVAPSQYEVRKFSELHPGLEADYPRKRLGAEEGPDFLPGRALSSPQCVFDQADPDGRLVRDITIGQIQEGEHALMVRRRDYRDWETTWEGEVLPVLGRTLPIFMRTNVRRIGLQFHNRFVWEGDPAGFRSDMVLDKDTPHLPRTLLAIQETWHCVQAHFAEMEGPEDRPHAVLKTVEASLASPNPWEKEPVLWTDIVTTLTLRADLIIVKDGPSASLPQWEPECVEERAGAFMESLRRETARFHGEILSGDLLDQLGPGRGK